MPIRAENKDRYPDNWSEISARVRGLAHQRCEWCGVRNHAWGYRENSKFCEVSRKGLPRDYGRPPFWFGTRRIIEIVLTVAHMDHQPENCELSNLKALCQKCHNAYDAPHRAAGIRERARQALGVDELPLPAPPAIDAAQPGRE